MYRFRITVEPLSTRGDQDSLQFEIENHDDIVAIARRMQGRFDLDEESSKAFAVGLKLLGEVVLKHRSKEPFSMLRPALAEFNQAVKSKATEAAS